MSGNDQGPRLAVPRSPFDGVRAQFSSPELGVYAWFITEPDGWICRYSPGLTLTGQIAHFVVEQGEPALLAHFPSTVKFMFVQDFSDMVSYEAEARKVLTEWGHRMAKQTLRTVVIPPPMNPMFRMGLSTAMLAMRLTGIHMETCPDVQQAIKKYKLKPDLRGAQR